MESLYLILGATVFIWIILDRVFSKDALKARLLDVIILSISCSLTIVYVVIISPYWLIGVVITAWGLVDRVCTYKRTRKRMQKLEEYIKIAEQEEEK